MAHVTLHITGGIAAYKAISLLREFQKNGDEVRVAMTPAATKFVTETTFGSLTKFPVLTDLWSQKQVNHIAHVELADWTDLAVVIPATANTIAKLAAGIADNAVLATLLATTAPKVVVPAMNSHMWSNAATKRNINLLKQDGIYIIEPDVGRLAEGYSGKGRLPEVTTIFESVLSLMQPKQQSLVKKQVLVTVGGTREDIDPVRFIGNRSSGKMGIAIANEAANQGANVTLIAGQVSTIEPLNPQIKVLHVTSTSEMAKLVEQSFSTTDVLIMAAAVADFMPVTRANQKIKKNPLNDEITFQFKKTPDILKTVGHQKVNQYVVGFAAETQDLLSNANKKLASKNADLIVANNVNQPGIGFGSDENQVTILSPEHAPNQWPKMSKKAIAEKLINLISNNLVR